MTPPSDLARQLAEQVDAVTRAATRIGALRELRDFALELAVRGRLVEQRASESPYAVKECEPRFDVPESWRWTTLGDVCTYIQRGKSPTYAERSGIPVVSQKCVQWDGFSLDRARFVVPASVEGHGPERFLRAGDLLWNSTGDGTVGRVCEFVPSSEYPKVVADSHVTIMRPDGVEPGWIWCWLASPTVQRTINDLVTGSTKQTELATSTVRSHPIPIPPLDEQKRIVARVNEMFALITQCESRDRVRRDARERLRSAVAVTLGTAEGRSGISQALGGMVHRFGSLFERPDDVGLLRESVVDAACSGAAFGSTEEWRRYTVAELAVDTRYGTAKKCDRDARLTPVLRIPNVVRSKLDLSDLKYADFAAAELEDLRLRPGDVLVVRSNGSKDLVGRACVVDNRAEGFAFAGYLIRLRLRTDLVSPSYFQLAMASSPVRRSIEGPARTTSGVHNVNTKELARLSFLAPSRPVQDRVVEWANRVLSLCDALESALRSRDETAGRLVLRRLGGFIATEPSRELGRDGGHQRAAGAA